jgi:phosphoadenosine phosphosulfate reductase
MGFSYDLLEEKDYEQFNNEVLKRKDALDVLKWAYQTFSDDIVYACSFGAEGMVLIDLISKVKKDAKIIFLDTDFHFDETYHLIAKVKEKYPQLKIELVKPGLTVQEQVEQYGERLWERDADLCCQMRKLEPLAKELAKHTAWISGLRREQGPTRVNTQFVNPDNRFQSIKVCPLIHWTWDDIWMYIKLHQLSYNELHDQNYPSIGCDHCTKPVQAGEDMRSGRWADAKKTECGLHQ